MSRLDDIKKEYEKLANLQDDSDGTAKRQRGFAFERLLNSLFVLDELDPRTSYRPAGEQIDGSFYLDGRIYLLEAKWHADPQPASTLYQFKGKVDGKLTGTIGIFISMSGYSAEAVDALTLGKDINIILFDRRDLHAAINLEIGFKKILKLKLRKAAEEGVIYFPTEGELVTAKKARTVEIDFLHYDHAKGGVMATVPLKTKAVDLLIVCEGDSDREVIAVFVERILAAAGSNRSIKILSAMGKAAIPRVVNAMVNNFDMQPKVLIVVDGDNDLSGTTSMLNNGLEIGNWIAAIPNPSIETWLKLDANELRRRGGKFLIDESRKSAKKLDIDALRKQDEEFTKFYKAVLQA